MAEPIAYGTAIRKRTSKRLLDVELSHSREQAERDVAHQNGRARDWDLRIEWVVVEIRPIEAD